VARALLAARLQKEVASEQQHLLCRLAAVELKAGEQQRGDALFAQACQLAPGRLAAVFQMLIEALRMPLDPARIKQLDHEFRRALKAKVDAASAVALLHTLYAFETMETSYQGMQEHQKLILQYLGRARRVAFSEADLQSICKSLQALPTNKLLLDFAMRGCKEFPQQPLFPFTVALYHLSRGPEKCPWHKVRTLLHTALNLARANPAYAELAQQIETILPMLQSVMLVAQFGTAAPVFGQEDEAFPDLLEAFAHMLGVPLDDEDELIDFDPEESDEWPRPAPRRGTPRPKHRRRQRRR
jgi:hypothetical protein